jgi:hypothetical protein
MASLPRVDPEKSPTLRTLQCVFTPFAVIARLDRAIQ